MWTALVACALMQAGEPAGLAREGPLQNETVLSVHAAAQAEIERGDAAWSRGEETAAFEAWRRALEVSATGDAVALVPADASAPRPWPDPDATHARRTEGVESGVLRRWTALDDAARARWRERFDSVAERALARASDSGRALARASDSGRALARASGYGRALARASGTSDAGRALALATEAAGWIARVERDWPGTSAAARAALWLADAALERGDAAIGGAWLARAERHALGLDPRYAEAVARRRALAAELETARATPAPEAAWTRARTLLPRGAARLANLALAGTRSPYSLPFGSTIEPAGAFLDDGSLVVLAPLVVARAHADARLQRFPVASLLALDDEVEPFVAPPSAGWPLCADTDGTRVYWVAGRSAEEHDNALVALGFDRAGRPVVPWSWTERGLVRGSLVESRESALGPGRWAFQPGPVLWAGRVYAQARQGGGEEASGASERLWLLCVDAETGALLWKRELGRPADLVASAGRRPRASAFTATPGMPLAVADGHVLAGTNAGFAVLVDALDGRIAWAFKNRRRGADEPGWPGTRRPEVERTSEGEILHWLPFDSDVAYALRAAPDLGTGVLASAPRRRERALDLFGLRGNRALAPALDGPRRVLAQWSGDAREASLALGREEHFSGPGLASPERALVATDRALYLFDRTRELFVLAAAPLEDAGAGRGGRVYARGTSVWVVGIDTLWTFEAR